MKIVAAVPAMRGVIVILEDGSAWYLTDPYFDGQGKPKWERLPAVPDVI